MRRTSTLSLVVGAFGVAVVATVLNELTKTGAAGVYAFLFTGVTAYMVFLMWPERTRFRGRPDSRSRRRRR